MTEERVYLTQEGLQKLRDELEFLQTKERSRISAEIAEARSHGDLSENAEYDAAKDAQGLLEARIAQLGLSVQNARIVDESLIDPSKVFVLSTVTVENLKTGKEIKYTLVAPPEADFTVNKISVRSPIGRALLGKSVGDTVEVNVPAGKLGLKVTGIER